MVTARKPEKPVKRAPKKKRGFDSLAYAIELSKLIPPEEQARMPRDLAANFDHYHDGAPKQR